MPPMLPGPFFQVRAQGGPIGSWNPGALTWSPAPEPRPAIQAAPPPPIVSIFGQPGAFSAAADAGERTTPRHPRYWFPGGGAVFVVDGTEYNVHRALMPSFDAAFYARHPRAAVDRFLALLYTTTKSPESAYPCTTAEDWVGVLAVAHPRHPLIVQQAIDALVAAAEAARSESAGDLGQTSAGGVRDDDPRQAWRTTAVRDLALRAAPVTAEEGRMVGLEVVLAAGAVRRELGANMARYVDEEKVRELVAREVARMKD